MKLKKSGYLLPILILFSAATVAGTLEEMKRLDAIELPGVSSICEGQGTVQSGQKRMKFEDWARGTVISKPGEPLRYHVERTNSVDGVVYAKYEFEMTTWLEKDAEIAEIDPDTVHASIPEDAAQNAQVVDFIRANKKKSQRFQDIHITTFPFYEIKPAQDDPMKIFYRCGPENHNG